VDSVVVTSLMKLGALSSLSSFWLGVSCGLHHFVLCAQFAAGFGIGGTSLEFWRDVVWVLV